MSQSLLALTHHCLLHSPDSHRKTHRTRLHLLLACLTPATTTVTLLRERRGDGVRHFAQTKQWSSPRGPRSEGAHGSWWQPGLSKNDAEIDGKLDLGIFSLRARNWNSSFATNTVAINISLFQYKSIQCLRNGNFLKWSDMASKVVRYGSTENHIGLLSKALS